VASSPVFLVSRFRRLTETPIAGAADTLASRKATLRRTALARRDGLSAEARARAGERIADLVAALDFDADAVVAGFWQIRSEIDPRPAMARLAATGRVVALPALTGDGETMVFRLWVPGEALVPATFGLSEPPASARQVEPAVLLIPLAAFDRRGGRIGYGGGYYDRALERLERVRPVLKIGVGYAVQEIDRVPEEAHDRRLDLILTEAGPIVPGGDTP
jgi:5-formyltetrahydrofolate cyclo-ligase